MMIRKMVPLVAIRLTPETQMRTENDGDYIAELEALFRENNCAWPEELPPVDLVLAESGYWIVDGHHRLLAADRAGCHLAKAIVTNGTPKDAEWRACAANKRNGMRRNRGDLARAIKRAWELAYEREPDRHWYATDIARHVGCSDDWARENCPGHLKQPTYQVGQTDSRDEGQGVEEIGPANDTPSVAKEPEPTQGDPDAILDGAGIPIRSKESASVFDSLKLFGEIEALLESAAKKIDLLAPISGAELYRAEHLKVTRRTVEGEIVESFHSPDLEYLRRELRHWQPFASVCPCCRRKPDQMCLLCRGLPYVTKAAWERSTAKQREAILMEFGAKGQISETG